MTEAKLEPVQACTFLKVLPPKEAALPMMFSVSSPPAAPNKSESICQEVLFFTFTKVIQ